MEDEQWCRKNKSTSFMSSIAKLVLFRGNECDVDDHGLMLVFMLIFVRISQMKMIGKRLQLNWTAFPVREENF